MTEPRYNELNTDDSKRLTDAEIKEGWHFCSEWDGLLVGPEMDEAKVCKCFPKEPLSRRPA